MEDIKKITVALSPEIIKELEDAKYNKSKLIDSLLTEHFKKEKIKKDIIRLSHYPIFVLYVVK